MMTTAPKRKTAAKAAVTIFEDVPEDHEMLLVEKKVTGKTLLSKPPAKMAAAAASKQKDGGMGDAPGMEGNGTNASISGGLRVGNVNGGDGNIRGHGLKKNPRRQTMFVPEDTSFLTIHPGANDTRRLDDSFQLPSYSTQKTISGINGAGNPRESRAAKPRASLAVAPKRLPLRETPSSGNISARDLPGA
jgi:abnormal spindle-like microcephaly-associated protein